MAVKVPPLLHKMSLASQKAWYKKHGMEMPSAQAADGKSAAQAKKDVGEINKKKARETAIAAAAAASKKNKELVSSSERVRMMRKNADMFGGGLGGGLERNRDIVNFVRSGGYIKAGRLGEETVEEAVVKTKDVNKEKLKNYVRSLGTKAVIAGKVPFDQVHSPLRAGRKVLKQESATEVNEMSYGKKLAKMIMAKQSKHPIAQQMGEEVKDVADAGEYDYEGDMAKSQLRSILTNAKRLHDMLEDTTNLPEWVQSKITLAEDYILTAANYMEGEMNEEVEQVDEKINLVKAKMGDVVKDFYKSKAPQFKGKSMAKRREMAVAAKLGAEREAGMREEVEQVDEQSPAEIKAKYYHDQFDKVKPVKAYDKEGKLVGRYRSMDHAKQMKPGHTYKVEEEVEQIDEMDKSQPAAGRDSDTPFPTKPIKVTDKQRASAKLMTRELLNQAKKQLKKEEVVTEAEGKVAVTPKEKALAAHHGDKSRITYGDVIKARLKSAAAKKMGK